MVVLFGLLGLAINLQPIPVIFGVNLLLGSTMPILVLLVRGGGSAVPIGVIASLATIKLWHHGWSVLIPSAEIVWLTVSFTAIVQQEGRKRFGHAVLSDVLFWLLIGTPLVFLLFHQVLHIDLSGTTLLALQQGVNGVLNTAIAFTIFLVVTTLRPLHEQKGLSLKDLVLAMMLLAITIPALIITVMGSHELEASIERSVLNRLEITARVIISTMRSDATIRDDHNLLNPSLAFEIRSADSILESSNRPLFSTLSRAFKLLDQPTIAEKGLNVIMPRQSMPEMKRWGESYWSHERFFHAHGDNGKPGDYWLQVIEPAAPDMVDLQQSSARFLGILAWILVIGSFLSEMVALFIDRQFQVMLKPLSRSGDPVTGEHQFLPQLEFSLVTELQDLASAVNQRGEQINRLTNALQSTNKALEEREQELKRLTTIDPMTGCFNRRELHRRLNEEILRSKRSGAGIIAISIDIDFFKAVNDTYGHDVGDQVLIAVVAVLKSRLRETDMLCRTGGEEFVVLLFGSSLRAAVGVAESMRSMVREVRVPTTKAMVMVTMSLGVAEWQRERDTSESLLMRSDQALLQAKRRGRDQVLQA
jgi:diguanylate cyclase (GGDEF)-like protein